MNMKLIQNAIKSYEQTLDENDAARLQFFSRIWAIQEDAGKEVAKDAYTCPSKEHLESCLEMGLTFLVDSPCKIDLNLLAKHAQRIAEYLVVEGSLAEDVQEAFEGMSWDELITNSDAELAGTKPFDYLDSMGMMLLEMEYTQNQARMLLMVVSLALRIQLEKVAIATKAALGKKGFEHSHPRTCPVCGCEASMAHVGAETSSSGRGKALICSQCGMVWEYDRVRCARCGTTSQGKLHYYNIEGDDAHRIGTCDECGGYIRTIFSEDALRPISYEVEDVVMAKLDAIASTFAKAQEE